MWAYYIIIKYFETRLTSIILGRVVKKEGAAVDLNGAASEKIYSTCG